MSADNYNLIDKYKDGYVLRSNLSASETFEVPIELYRRFNDVVTYPTLEEAVEKANEEYTEYGTTIHLDPPLDPAIGMIAICSNNRIGLICSKEPEEITYPDGETGLAWTGIHLDTVFDSDYEAIGALPGEPWSSRTPIVIDPIWGLSGRDFVGDLRGWLDWQISKSQGNEVVSDLIEEEEVVEE